MDEKVIEIEHLTVEQLATYAAGTFESKELHVAAGKHLLQCADCLAAMQPPTPEQFLSVLFGEVEPGENEKAKRQKSVFAFPLLFSHSFTNFSRPKILAWSAAALFVVMSFSIFAWFGSVQHVSNNIALSSANSEPSETIVSNTINSGSATQLQSVENKNVISNTQIIKLPKSVKPPALKTKQQSDSSLMITKEGKNASAEVKKLQRPSNKKNKIGSPAHTVEEPVLRGSTNQDSDLTESFSLLTPVGEVMMSTQPEFRWEKLLRAKSYRISIFDSEFNEVLSAETTENSFRPDKPLKRGEKYLWRVAAQTVSGNEVVSPRPPQPPITFQIADEQNKSRIETLKKRGKATFDLATLYAKEEIFDLAVNVLQHILAHNPNHRAARRLLMQIEKHNSANQPSIQRCESAPTTRKAAQ